ncbi:MAG: hypothetical protein UW83_C0030G0005 [Parcubacteria group bacterium GW2011_GWD1_44_9]|nr:MAG: hypothetical protein UV94_C0042G0005 [Parcubacteria group bacterium GW2011_GWC1_43_30]KKT84982.1 MAG: hypothetical protein UW83_C0030G0005 [Parcubacteria group bacterium GW2011_GWD1_44_9]
MTTSLPKVLIVEDDEQWQGIWTRHLEREGAEVLMASSLEEGERLFEVNPDLTLVIMDGCVPGERPNSMPLVQKMRQTFRGPIVAGSGNPNVCKTLVEAGCSHWALKHMVSGLVSKILKEM